MDAKTIAHDNPRSYIDVRAQWMMALRHNESGTWIFPPLAGVTYLIQQFVEDAADISVELYNDKNALCAVNCMLSEDSYTKEALSRELALAISERLSLHESAAGDLNDLLQLASTKHKKVVLLVHGLDVAVRAGNMGALIQLNRLAQLNAFISVVLVMTTDMTDPQFSTNFGTYSALLQNVSIFPRKSQDEGLSFLQYLEKSWGVTLSTEQKRWVEDNLDHSLRFTKEVFRQVQLSPGLTYDQLYALPSFEYKVQALLDNLLDDQRQVVLRVVFHEPIGSELTHALKFLKTINWVTERDGQLRLTVPLLDYYVRRGGSTNQGRKSLLTPKEDAAFRLLEMNRGQVVSRDQLADAIWGDASIEKYSDWAIDQLVHRLKMRIAENGARQTIKAVRGRGFTLSDQ